MTPKRIPASSLPMKPVVYYLLAALASGEKHGYAIRRDLVERSEGRLQLDSGTLYRLIARLLEDGLLEKSDASADVEAKDARRRYYRLAPSGRAAYVAETRRMAGLVDAARATGVIGAGGATSPNSNGTCL